MNHLLKWNFSVSSAGVQFCYSCRLPGLNTLCELHSPLLWGLTAASVKLPNPPKEMFEKPSSAELWSQLLGLYLLAVSSKVKHGWNFLSLLCICLSGDLPVHLSVDLAI